MKKLKYIINELDLFMIFPELVQHIDAARTLIDGIDFPIVGAGFIFMEGGQVQCYGESISLGIKSRKEDAQIIADALGLEVFK